MKALGSGAEVEVDVNHRIEYEGCAARDRDPGTRTARLKSARNYIQYEGQGQEVLRFISTASVLPLGEGEDPCRYEKSSDFFVFTFFHISFLGK